MRLPRHVVFSSSVDDWIVVVLGMVTMVITVGGTLQRGQFYNESIVLWVLLLTLYFLFLAAVNKFVYLLSCKLIISDSYYSS
jgi:hypothetical protein